MSDLTFKKPPSPSLDATQGYGSPGYRAYVLFALIVVYTFNFIDRTLVSVLGEPIRETFGLSDTMMGVLSGPAFAFLYTFLGIPFAMLAERRSRTWIISGAMAAWSAMTVACGMAQTSWQFFFARMGVGIGEAGCSPPSHSLISDYFPPESRTSALGIFALGIPVGTMLAALGGAWIATQGGLNWRDAFIFMGLPGIFGAIIFKLTVKEPPRGYSDPGGAARLAAKDKPGIFEAFGVLARKRSFWHVSLGGAIASFTGYGIGQFVPSFWIRAHGLDLMSAALIFGGVLGLAAGVGTFGSGIVADRVRARHPNSDSWLPAIGLSVCVPFALFGYNTLSFSTGTLAITLAVPALAISAVLRYSYLAPMFSVTQKLAPPRMRATAAALMLFVVNLIGYGAGPPVIGWISDQGTAWQLRQLDAPLTASDCGPIERALKAAADNRGGDISASELQTMSLQNATYCAPARKTGVRWGVSIGILFLLWAALHFLLLRRTMKDDLWSPTEAKVSV